MNKTLQHHIIHQFLLFHIFFWCSTTYYINPPISAVISFILKTPSQSVSATSGNISLCCSLIYGSSFCICPSHFVFHSEWYFRGPITQQQIAWFGLLWYQSSIPLLICTIVFFYPVNCSWIYGINLLSFIDNN